MIQPRAALIAAAGLAAALMAGACSGEAPAPVAEQTELPEGLANAPQPEFTGEPGIGTPLADRVATLGLINKRNNISQDIELKPGESRRIGDVVLRLQSCERTPPWEDPAETGAFVQVLVNERVRAGEEPQFRRIFSGWLFRNSPSLNVVEHPVYDVWVKDCAMSFPGEEGGAAPRAGAQAAPAASAQPAADPAAPETPAPAPEPAEPAEPAA